MLLVRTFSGFWRATDILQAALLVVLLAAGAFELGIYTREERLNPLPHNPESVYIAFVGFSLPFRPLIGSGGDSMSGRRSDLRLWVNEREWGPPHAIHGDIQAGSTRAFSHWGDYVYFSRSEAEREGASPEFRVRYSAR